MESRQFLAAALIEGTEFKANGNALEFAYGQGDNKYEHKINEHGLTTWAKTTWAVNGKKPATPGASNPMIQQSLG